MAKKKRVVRQINHNEAKTLLDNGAVLIDVRERFELMSKKVPSAIHVPLSAVHGKIETNGPMRPFSFARPVRAPTALR